mgnify:CR=1 FL=1
MSRKAINVNVSRKLYSESMGRCMNPSCETELFLTNGDIAEKAHIVPHCETEDNSFENLILLCPNCHTNFDKNFAFDAEEVQTWKSKRQEQLSKVFAKRLNSFKALEEVVKPILEENKTIYENYYLKEHKKLWDKSEEKILLNNNKLKLLLENNKHLIQHSDLEGYSNLEVVNEFLLHIDEFSETRKDDEKIRSALFPREINSLFGINSVFNKLMPSTGSLECLVRCLQRDQKFIELCLGIEEPFIEYKEKEETVVLYLNDEYRLRQTYSDYKCFRKQKVRFDSLNFALTFMNNNSIQFEIENLQNLANVTVKGNSFKFIYEYCLSKSELISLSPQKDLVIVNLHNWNGSSCISKEAYKQAEIMDVTLLTMDAFYKYVHKI